MYSCFWMKNIQGCLTSEGQDGEQKQMRVFIYENRTKKKKNTIKGLSLLRPVDTLQRLLMPADACVGRGQW